MSRERHKCFISYHHADQEEIDNFIEKFDEKGDIFIARALDISDDIIRSTNPDYVMQRIRQLYLTDSTVTIVLIGKCTWARRYVDWELQSSLRHGEKTTPNGLIGIILPSARNSPKAPNRLLINLKSGEGYARIYWYPDENKKLVAWIEDAFNARTTRAHLIDNPLERFSYNKECP